MTTISIRLPDSLHKMAKNIASEDHVSINQFIASAVAEKISALTTEKYLGNALHAPRSKNFRLHWLQYLQPRLKILTFNNHQTTVQLSPAPHQSNAVKY